MRCSGCGSTYTDYGEHFDICPDRIRIVEEWYERITQAMHLNRGQPQSASGRTSLREAERNIKALLKRREFKSKFKYQADDLLESENWWYVPYFWIGCQGFIADKKGGYVNWLASSSTTPLTNSDFMPLPPTPMTRFYAEIGENRRENPKSLPPPSFQLPPAF